uniref:Mitochondrial calcium uniporter dominant negative beta subunit n=1 Tax=Mus musculus TaxID=10090 RepID=D6RI54_MOUSE
MPGALSGRRMLPSGLCLGRWQLLRTIRARGRGDPRELPSTPQK